jgi:prevent-host-death family protein
MPEVGAYEAKTHLPKLLERIQRGERFVITKHGRPIAELVPASRPDTESVRQPECCPGRMHSFRDRVRAPQNSRQGFAGSQPDPDGMIAAQRSGTGQDQIAHAGETVERARFGSHRDAEGRHHPRQFPPDGGDVGGDGCADRR